MSIKDETNKPVNDKENFVEYDEDNKKLIIFLLISIVAVIILIIFSVNYFDQLMNDENGYKKESKTYTEIDKSFEHEEEDLDDCE